MKIEDKKKAFKNKIEELYPERFEEIVKYLSKPPSQFFRVTQKAESVEKVIDDLQKQEFILKEVNLPYNYQIFKVIEDKSIRLSETEAFKKGEIYIQDPSSMLPVLVLKEYFYGGRVLDMCAAPGSKTTQLTESVRTSSITAVEKDRKRFYILSEIMDKYTDGNVTLINADARQLSKRHPALMNSYDAILLDAPCSSEGRLYFSEDESFTYWNTKKEKEMSGKQTGLFNAAYDLLKPGGILLYSTCTLGIKENEKVVDKALKKFKDLEVLDFDSAFLEMIPHQSGMIEWTGKPFNTSVSKTVRVLPNDIYSAFYMALLRKKV